MQFQCGLSIGIINAKCLKAGTVQEQNQLISRLDFSYKKSSMAQFF